MRVTVHLHANLARGRGQGVLELDVAEGSTIRDVLAQLGLTSDERLIAGVNGEAAAPDVCLRADDRIDLVTPMAGG